MNPKLVVLIAMMRICRPTRLDESLRSFNSIRDLYVRIRSCGVTR